MNTSERLAALEARLQRAEDHLAILNLLNAYGPLVDSGSSTEASALWAEGGGFAFAGGVGDGSRVEAGSALVDVYEAEWHQELIRTGSAHLTATPVVTVADDRATALAYSFVIRREGDRWFVLRASANHWTLQRTDAGWRVVERTNRLLDGSSGSHDLLRRVLEL